MDKTNTEKLKSDYNLIKSALIKYKSKAILLDEQSEIEKLDDAPYNMADKRLFSDIIDFDILSIDTKSIKKGSWLKNSDDLYTFYINSSKKVQFSLQDGSFVCVSLDDICKELN